jgi:signal transduction histidine kinase/DNA-binding response OmpR family regulator
MTITAENTVLHKDRVLIVDDDESTRRILSLILQEKGYEAEAAETGQEAITKAKTRHFNVAFLDIKLPDTEGTDLATQLKHIQPDTAMIIITGHASVENAVRAVNCGAAAYIVKPLNMDEVLFIINQVIEKQQLALENRRLIKELQEELAERKRVEEELRERESFNFALFQYNPIPTIVVDLKGRVVKSNLAKRNSGDPLPDLTALMYEEYECDHEIDMRSELMECIKSGKAKEFPEQNYGDKYLSITISPFSHGAMIMSKDITEWKRAEEEAARVRALEELDHLKTALLASVSHELRTPLTSIKGIASTLIQPDVEWDEESQKEFLNDIDQAADGLTRIVSDLIDMSQLEAGVMNIVKTNTTIPLIVNQIKGQLGNLTLKYHFRIHIPRDLPLLWADEVRIGQVIINLVSNAAAYSEEGTTINLQAILAGNEIVVSVTDEGVGIAPEHWNTIFDRFYRLGNGVSRRRSGSGLGLSICQGILEAHCGRIWVESTPGKGSKFTFSLPVTADSG